MNQETQINEKQKDQINIQKNPPGSGTTEFQS
jgi:hypothetical protein